MVSEKILVNGDGGCLATAQRVTEDFARRAKLGQRARLRLGLLVEETLGMVRAMVDDFYGRLWLSGEDGVIELHLEATARMNSDRKQELLSVSSSGMNASARGFMGMLGAMISRALYAYGRETIQHGIVHTEGESGSAGADLTPIWTLQSYRGDLSRRRDEDGVDGAWDELEKSIVANLADDVIVGVKGDRIEMVISRDMG